MEKIQINDIKIYLDFKQRGYTTVGALSHFDEMKKEGVGLITVSKESKEKFEQILNNAKRIKHFQTKHGGNIFFCMMEFVDRNISYNNKVLISGIGIAYDIFGNFKEKRAFITDLTNMVDYKITNRLDLQWLSEFREKIKPNGDLNSKSKRL